jgi:hypothetical protein
MHTEFLKEKSLGRHGQRHDEININLNPAEFSSELVQLREFALSFFEVQKGFFNIN